MKTRIKKALTIVVSVVLSAVLTVSSSAAGFGDLISGDPLRQFFYILNLITSQGDSKDYVERPLEQVEYTPEQLAQRNAIAELINKDLNKIKTQKPAFVKTTNRGLPGSDGQQAGSTIASVADIIESISTLLWGKDKNPIHAETILQSLGITSFFADQSTLKHLTGLDCKDTVSVAGQDYVCAIEGKDIFNDNSITRNRYNESYTFKVYLQDAVNPDEDSPHAKVFDLFSDEKLYQTIASLAPNVDWQVLRIRYVDCYIEGSVDRYGNVTKYKTHYKCILQIDTSQGVYDINQYLDAINNTEIFESEVVYDNFNWTPRPFCDVNNDGKINSADARYVLQIAAKLEELQPDTLLYGDVNGDGKITSADARRLLRIAANLDTVPPNAIDGTLNEAES